MMKPSVNHQKFHLERLRDLNFAALYLSVILEDNDSELFLLALRDIVASQGGMKLLAAKTKIGRETLYKMLSTGGNPGIYNVQTILDALGFKLSVQEKIKKTKIKRVKLKKAS